MSCPAVRIFAAVAGISVSPAAFAWETAVETQRAQWRSTYLPAAPLEFENEHAQMTDAVLRSIGAGIFASDGELNPVNGRRRFRVIDLNASLFRRDVLASLEREGDDPMTPLEERVLPAPSLFTGLPDVSYALHDWINKNALCSALPDSILDQPLGGLPSLHAGTNREGCHSFTAWLGALNANHFGTQAGLTYLQLHRVALALAARAKDLRDQLDADHLAVHRAHVEERELEALAYEGVAQHFLQDRWSVGHMWERWASGDFQDNQLDGSTFFDVFTVGAASGLIHGSESITGEADPMCSPVVGLLSTDPVEWSQDGGKSPGVGDHRYSDMVAGTYKGRAIDVATQQTRMSNCIAAGYAEVIRAFGAAPGGGFGVFDVPLANAPGPQIISPGGQCLTPYATNRAMRLGLDSGIDLSSLARIVVEVVSVGRDGLPVDRTTLVALDGAIRLFDAIPDGTEVARGIIGGFSRSQTNNSYLVARHIEPEDLSALPDRADGFQGQLRAGMDKDAIFGFFNRAHADYWCPKIEGMLATLRGSADPIERAACAHFADQVYAGTIDTYGGAQREIRNKDGRPVRPICSFFGVGTTSDPERLPVRILPGYVRVPESRSSAAHSHDYSFDSIANWCLRAPILNVDDADVAAEVTEDDTQANFSGLNLGAASGQILIDDTGVTVSSWSETAVGVSIAGLSPGDHTIRIIRADGVESAGRFVLRVGQGPLINCPADPGMIVVEPPDGCTGPNAMALSGGVITGPADLGRLAGATCIAGDLTFRGPGAVGLRGLGSVVSVGNLRFEQTGMVDVSALLQGLRRATSVVADGNATLVELSFPALERVVNDIQIMNNAALTRVVLPALKQAGGLDLRGAGTAIVDLPELVKVERGTGNGANVFLAGGADLRLPVLSIGGGDVELRNAPGIPGIELPCLREVRGFVSLIDANAELPALGSIGAGTMQDGLGGPGDGDLMLRGAGTTRVDFRSLSALGGDLIVNATGLAGLPQLPALSNVPDDVEITNNAGVLRFSGLEALASIGGDLSVRGNTALASLAGLEAVTRIDGQLQISDNRALVTAEALSRLDSVGNISAVGNVQLSRLGLSGLARIERNVVFSFNCALETRAIVDLLDQVRARRGMGGGAFLDQNGGCFDMDDCAAGGSSTCPDDPARPVCDLTTFTCVPRG